MRLASFLAMTVTLVATSSALASGPADPGAKPQVKSAICESSVTGSRIRHVRGQCGESMYLLRSFSGEKLARTGGLTTQETLKLLDARF